MATRIVFSNRQAPTGDQWQAALHAALIAALPGKVVGVGSDAPTNKIIVIMDAAATGDDDNAALVIVAAHDTDTRTPEQQTALDEAATTAAAATAAANIPTWASFTEAQALAWLDAHVSATQVDAIASLADAKVVLNDMATLQRALVRLIIALRDDTWPGLSN